MAVIEISKVQVRRGQENTTGIPQLDSGEFGWAEDTENLYIGKRVVDGASNDNNTRILTDKDISGLFDFIKQNNTSTVISAYKYRQGVSYLDTYTTTTTVQVKLDTINPSITDFGTVVDGGDITAVLLNAITAIYANPVNSQDTRRALIIPPGNYSITNAVMYLPPYVRLIGSGPNITTITVDGSFGHNLFQTTDALGVYLGNTGGTLMQSGDLSAREIRLENMTLEFISAPSVETALLSLDNVVNAYIDNVEFRGVDGVTPSANTIGIQIRGTSGLVTGDTNISQNIYIKNCRFSGLAKGIEASGASVRGVVSENWFNNLSYGIRLEPASAVTVGPNNFNLSQNRFENIYYEGIYVGTNPNNNAVQTNHISAENFFVQEGNGAELGDDTNTPAHPVISFLSNGNKTVKDMFYRREVADKNARYGSNPNFYYNPLVAGNSVIDDGAIYTSTVVTSVSTVITAIPLNGKNQMATIDYQISNPDTQLSRKGSLLVNVAPDGTAVVSDKYNYSENISIVATGLKALPGSGLDTFVISADPNATFIYTDPISLTTSSYTFGYVKSSIEQRTGSWYLSQDNMNTALLTTINVDNVNLNYVVTSVSSNPQFNYDPAVNTGSWSLLYGPPAIDFSAVTTATYNYTAIVCTTSSSAFSITPSLIEYTVKLDT